MVKSESDGKQTLLCGWWLYKRWEETCYVRKEKLKEIAKADIGAF